MGRRRDGLRLAGALTELQSADLRFSLQETRGLLDAVGVALSEVGVAAEYEGVDWHSGADALRRDRRKLAAVQDVGWVSVPILFEDIRHHPREFVARMERQLQRRAAVRATA